MRGQGRIYRRTKHGRVLPTWWLDYTSGGKRFRESSETTHRTAALALLRQRAGDRDVGKRIGVPENVRLAEYQDQLQPDGTSTRVLVGGLRALVERQYQLDGNRSLDRVQQAYARLEAFFGADAKVPSLTTPRLDAYAAHRLDEGAARATVNYELAALRRGFRLAIKKGILAAMPTIELPKPQNRRTGFFEAGELAALMLELPADARRDLIEFLRWTGWRRDEGRLLTWANVDRETHTLQLTADQAKAKEPRVFPFALAPDLVALFARRWEARDGVYVFHQGGALIGIGALRSAWTRATSRAGLTGRLLHDLRRTRARELRRVLAESDIMDLCGWETREVFKRYAIKDERHLEQSVGRAFGTPAAHSTPPAAPRPSGG